VPPDTIKDIVVELTVVGGRIVHDAAAPHRGSHALKP
jgi:hypothetical protein